MPMSGATPSYPGQRPSGDANDVRVYQAPPKAASERGIANKSTSTSVTGRGTSGTSNVIWWIIAAIGLAIILYFALRR